MHFIDSTKKDNRRRTLEESLIDWVIVILSAAAFWFVAWRWLTD